MATATCFISTPMSISNQRMAMIRPNPGCVPMIKKNGPATSSSKNPSLSTIRVSAISKISSPATTAANIAANAISSRVVH